MLPFFARKPKSKHMKKSNSDSPKPHKANDHIMQFALDDQSKADSDVGRHKRCAFKTHSHHVAYLRRVRTRASSASPQPTSFTRRGQGASVTFESTLPTQVWQASPSPSPPPMGPPVPLDDRMVCSVSDDWSIRATEPLLRPRDSTGRGKRIDACLNSWLSDIDMDDSSDDDDETNPSGVSQASLSSCSSSDESLTGEHKQIRTTSSSTTTVTTDSGSSLDLVRTTTEETPVSNIRTKQSQRVFGKKSERVRKSGCEKKRRNFPTLTPSSSSSSSDEDLEALGWDEKTIAALTKRGKTRQPQQSQQQQQKQKQLKSRTGSSATTNQPCINSQVSHPHSCVLSRRANNPALAAGTNYQLMNCRLNNGARAICNSRGAPSQRTELLAVITSNYKPSREWEEQYKVLSAKKGDYVCVLSQPLSSRTSATKTNSTSTDNSNTNQPRPDRSKCDPNTWLYVRRWCVDHLVATGPPGFVPRHLCRLLPSTEIIRLWQQSQLSRTARTQTAMQVIPKLSDVSAPSMVCVQISGPDIMQSTINTSLARIQVSDNPLGGSIHSPSTNSTASVCVPNTFARNRIESGQLTSQTGPFLGHNQLPPPPPGFGSGGSLGSETEDRDSGRGPSSGSEWGSGRGGSSSVTLDRPAVEKTSSDTGLERRTGTSTERARNTKSAEESQLGWFAPDGSLWSFRDEEVCSHDSALQSPSVNDLTPQLQVKSLQYPSPAVETEEQFASPVTLTTRTGYTPVLEMRPAGTPTLYARRFPTTPQNGTDSLAASTTTCATVIENKSGSDPETSTCHDRTDTPDPTCWEPYKTVIHVNENCLEKFTLV
ncbi:unnamed protein product [Calicophoron daubneyi]|uniref:Uncharacterized protein n=1 Tax=Calicophoron daubneyi TaxID=300641 RepID=A0AAV2TKH0_CALDB